MTDITIANHCGILSGYDTIGNLDKMSKKIILLMTAPRSGSSCFCSEMASYRDMRNFFEFFWFTEDLHVPLPKHVLKDRSLYTLPENQKIIEQHAQRVDYKKRLSNSEYLALFGSDQQTGLTYHSEKLTSDPIAALKKLATISPKNIIIKIQYLVAEKLPMADILAMPNIEVILLKRENHLARHVSLVKGLQTSVWSNADTSHMKIRVDPQWFQREQLRVDNFYINIENLLDSIGKKYLYITYEELFTNYDRSNFYMVMDPWLRDVNISTDKKENWPIYYKKQMNKPIESSIENLEELKHLGYI